MCSILKDLGISALNFQYFGYCFRYLVWLEAFLTNIDISHPGARKLLENGGIGVTRSLIPGSRCAVDKTMEETFMKFSKSIGMSEFNSLQL